MKPFSLEEYLENPKRKVVTRGGSPVKIHCTNYNTDQPIIAEIEGTNLSESFNKDGKWLHLEDSEKDLFFAPEKHEGWLNIYRSESGFYLRGNPYKSKEEADEVARANYKTFCTTVKIEWEE